MLYWLFTIEIMNINHVDIFLKGAKDKATPKEFSLSVIHIFPDCSPNLKKGLRDEFYKLNGRCEIYRNKVELREENPLLGFYGSRINVEAIVGVNGSGKSSLFEIIYRVINNLSCLLNRGKRRKTADDLYYVKDLNKGISNIEYDVLGNLYGHAYFYELKQKNPSIEPSHTFGVVGYVKEFDPYFNQVVSYPVFGKNNTELEEQINIVEQQAIDNYEKNNR